MPFFHDVLDPQLRITQTSSHMKSPYLQYKDYMKARYGEPLFRVPIDFGAGCPNREADGSGGCTFCNERGGRAVQTIGKESVREQMTDAIRFARDRYGAKKYMAYIQAFSATFDPDRQQQYRDLLNAFDFAAVSIGTRPDCLTPQAYDFLVELNQHIEVWVELGMQTVHDRTLKRINRGHDWAASEWAIKRLHELGINVAAHVILGLPGETTEDFQQTADTLAALPIDAIKIHNLHIERGTTLAEEYNAIISRERTQRTQNPTEPDPLCSLHSFAVMAKGQFRDYVIQQMVCREWRQGDLFGNLKLETGNWKPKVVATADASVTFWNEDYKEHYHTPAGARLEAMEKYIVPGKLKRRLAEGDVQLLDVCFGLGYNSLCALNQTEQDAPSTLSITALEMDRRVVGAAAQNIQPLETDSFDWKKTLEDLHDKQESRITDYALLNILWGDARYTITKLPSATYDLVFLDAFSTQRNSELWTVGFFRKLKATMKPDAVLLTYCAAIPVRAGLLEAGFFVGETDPVGRQRGGTIAALRESDIEIPLPDHELKLIRETTRGLPYRDPHGVWTNKEILRDRQERILQSKKEESSNH